MRSLEVVPLIRLIHPAIWELSGEDIRIGGGRLPGRCCHKTRSLGEDFALIVNEYSTVVGVVTLNDVMSTVMGELVTPEDEEPIVLRDDGSWLIDGHTPMADVQRALNLDDLPSAEAYDTLAGFLMVMLRRVPRRTDSVLWGGHRFEVMDVDNYRIDQVLVTRSDPASSS